MSIQNVNSLTLPYRDLLEKTADVVSWRMFSSSGQESMVGYVRKSVADIYNPASQKNSVAVSYAIEFENGTIAYGAINPTQANPTELLALARSTATDSQEPLPLPPTTGIMTPPRLVETDGFQQDILTKLLPIASNIREKLIENNMKSFEGTLDASYSEDTYHDSNGLALYEESAMYGGFCEIEGRIMTLHNSRLYPESYDTLMYRIPELARFANSLKQPTITPEESKLPVFIPSGTAMINTYLLEHMIGSAVESGSSLYSHQDFKDELEVTHPSLTLHFDQTRDMHHSSFVFTPEGITGQKFDLIKNGRLVEPICNLKAAHRLGYSPRVPSSAASAVFNTLPDFEKLRQEVGTFLVAFTIMGLHSQNNMTGDYSLPCPDTLYFKNGELVGPVRAVITGNFFDVMKSGNMRFVHSDLAQAPVLLFDTDVTFSR